MIRSWWDAIGGLGFLCHWNPISRQQASLQLSLLYIRLIAAFFWYIWNESIFQHTCSNSKCFCFFQIVALRSEFFFCSHITMDVLVVFFGFDCDYRRSGCVNPVPGFPIRFSGSCFQSVKFSKPNDRCKTFSSSFVESFTWLSQLGGLHHQLLQLVAVSYQKVLWLQPIPTVGRWWCQ
jgi:hypothetical protein